MLGALANDWALSGIVTLQSGVPVPVTQHDELQCVRGVRHQRPNLVGDPELPPDQRTPTHWFNTAAFEIAPQFTLGSASRNPVRGPSYRNVDLAVSRRVPAGPGCPLTCGPKYSTCSTRRHSATPNAVAGAANFGTITTAGDPRVVQLAVKVSSRRLERRAEVGSGAPFIRRCLASLLLD